MPPLAERASGAEEFGRYSRSPSYEKPVVAVRSCEERDANAADWLLEDAAIELEWMKSCQDNHGLHRFPSACLRLVKSLPGNGVCIDCRSRDTDWATTSYGALLCLQCSARHRSLGVEISKVRSLTLDHWSHEQVLSMLEGGNQQLHNFFDRHYLTTSSARHKVRATAEPLQVHRYRTKAARFYRQQLSLHVTRVASNSVYQGREASRKKSKNVATPTAPDLSPP